MLQGTNADLVNLSHTYVLTMCVKGERFGVADGASGWKWENNGIGMGGKDAGVATQAKPTMGKNKEYKVRRRVGKLLVSLETNF